MLRPRLQGARTISLPGTSESDQGSERCSQQTDDKVNFKETKIRLN